MGGSDQNMLATLAALSMLSKLPYETKLAEPRLAPEVVLMLSSSIMSEEIINRERGIPLGNVQK